MKYSVSYYLVVDAEDPIEASRLAMHLIVDGAVPITRPVFNHHKGEVESDDTATA